MNLNSLKKSNQCGCYAEIISYPLQTSELLKQSISNKGRSLIIQKEVTNEFEKKSKFFKNKINVQEKENIENVCNLLIDSILENSPFAIKKGLEAYSELPNLNENEKHSFLKNQLSEIRNSADAKEGILAFKEKRKPNWGNF